MYYLNKKKVHDLNCEAKIHHLTSDGTLAEKRKQTGFRANEY